MIREKVNDLLTRERGSFFALIVIITAVHFWLSRKIADWMKKSPIVCGSGNWQNSGQKLGKKVLFCRLPYFTFLPYNEPFLLGCFFCEMRSNMVFVKNDDYRL